MVWIDRLVTGALNTAMTESYEGRWWLGEYDGLGRKEYANGDWYDGEWKEGKMHGEGTFNLAARDWSKTPREKWSTGKDWTFEGTFANDRAIEGIFKDGIQNGTKVTRLKFQKPVEMLGLVLEFIYPPLI